MQTSLILELLVVALGLEGSLPSGSFVLGLFHIHF